MKKADCLFCFVWTKNPIYRFLKRTDAPTYATSKASNLWRWGVALLPGASLWIKALGFFQSPNAKESVLLTAASAEIRLHVLKD